MASAMKGRSNGVDKAENRVGQILTAKRSQILHKNRTNTDTLILFPSLSYTWFGTEPVESSVCFLRAPQGSVPRPAFQGASGRTPQGASEGFGGTLLVPKGPLHVTIDRGVLQHGVRPERGPAHLLRGGSASWQPLEFCGSGDSMHIF
jgi:hypothetical protein